MIDKIKAFWQKIGDWVAYVLAPIFALAGVIWYLFNKNSELKQELAQSEAEKQIAHTLAEKERAQQEANDAEAEFNRESAELSTALDEFRKGGLPNGSK